MYLKVLIDDYGYIRPSAGAGMVHKETRGMHQTYVCSPMLNDAKPTLRVGHAVLELTEEGGGKALWVRGCDRERWDKLLKIWNGCYGAWPIHELKEV